MKKLFFFMACVAMSVLSFGQDNQLVWANGHLLYGTPVESIDSLTYDEMEDIDTLHLLLPRTLITVVHDTVVETQIVHDTIIQIEIVHDTIYYVDNHEYVDLGLSVKWATCNVGANSPEEYGDYFAWGEVEPKEVYDWSTYKWGNSNETQTKYCTDSNYGTVDNKTVLESADDAATANWGGAWRMPTYEELDELLTKCTWIVATMNGVDGCKVIGPNGNSIFLPNGGYRQVGWIGGREGTYWSSSLYAASNYASEINSRSDGTAFWNFGPRCYGNSIRPVCE